MRWRLRTRRCSSSATSIEFRIHTNWTNSISQVHEFGLEDLRDAAVRQKLKWVMSDPERLKPGKTRQALTEEAAGEFAKLAQRLRERGDDPEIVAHFINRLVFCMFAEDVGLLPNRMFTRMLEHTRHEPGQFKSLASELFRAMKDGGRIGFERVEWFNGGLFDDDRALPLEKADIELTQRAANLDWAEIDPSIFGTLFERGLDPDKRSQLGAHYTDRDKIMLLVEPVVIRPWLREWGDTMRAIEDHLTKSASAKAASTRTRARNEAERLYRAFLDRLRAFRVLDPACGSGNFLNLALLALKDLEHRASIEAEALGLHREFPQVGPASVLGIEINPYAAELARVSVWIGEIQWMLRNGFAAATRPILKPLHTIECRDALLNDDGSEAAWPRTGVIIGNPPFLGGKMLISGLGEDYVRTLFSTYDGKVPREADLVCYWFAKAAALVGSGALQRAGLVATNSIRGGANRKVLDNVRTQGAIFDAWDDEPWVVEGAAVRVSLISFSGRSAREEIALDGQPAQEIFSDLTAARGGRSVDLTRARRLDENRGVAFMGDTKGGAFDVPGDLARQWLRLPINPNGRPNSDVLRPWVNGLDLTRRPRDMWIIDFGWQMSETEAAMYEAPFAYVLDKVFPERLKNRREAYRTQWWRHVEPRPGMWAALSGLSSCIATPTVAKHRLFIKLSVSFVPDHQLIVIARDDDATLGIVHSRFHELWSLRLGTWLGVGNDPRYTPRTTFETFPFPAGMAPTDPLPTYEHAAAKRIATAARRLSDLRDAWLNPPDLVMKVPEVIPGYPDRTLPKDDAAAAALKPRTLTNLYNQRPAWLVNAHRELDAAVAAAYGWPEDLSDDDALTRLFQLNQTRSP